MLQFNGIQVSRRYKHFDWLLERLSAKFVLTPIPPLPEKQVSGEDFASPLKAVSIILTNTGLGVFTCSAHVK